MPTDTNETNRELHKLPSENFPSIVFDVTLYDLLRAELAEDEELETLCQFKPNSNPEYGDVVPFSEKYIIHCGQVDDPIDLAHLQLENCSHLLMFSAGPMNVIFVAAEGKVDDPNLTKEYVDYRARHSFGAIQESQRQTIKTFANVEDLIKNHNGAKIRWGFAMDCAERLPCLHHPELIYRLNSKRWLAECSLKSANDSIVDCEVHCPKHMVGDRWYYGGRDCIQCQDGVEHEVQRVKHLFDNTSTPFVVKMTQSLSSVGTRREREAKSAREYRQYLKDYLPRISQDNMHLSTTALILSDFIDGETTALNFFVRRDGSYVFLGACHQLATGQSGRQSTAINFPEQESLESKYRPILTEISRALHEEGDYYGPAGADVMENPRDGTFYTIDLNVRMALSLVLYGLKTHFWYDYGLTVAMAIECITLELQRDDFEKKFHKEFSEARIVVLGSTKLGQKPDWAYGLILAGENKNTVDDLTKRIEEFDTGKQADS